MIAFPMYLLTSIAVPLLRGAAIAAMMAGLADGWSIALGGGADIQALCLGSLLLATGWGASHRGSARPPARASFLWLVIGGCALPMISAWAPWSGLAAALYLLPLRVLGARLSAIIEASNRPATAFGAHLFGAALGLCWVAGAGLGFGGYLLAAALAGMSTIGAPEPSSGSTTEDPPYWSRITQRFTGIMLGAGLCWSFALFAPLVRAQDASDALSDARAAMTLILIAWLAWITLGAVLGEYRAGSLLAAVAAAAASFLLPVAVGNWLAFSQPVAFDALLRLPALRSLLQTGTPRLPEQHLAYLPLIVTVGAGLPVLLLTAAARGWFGSRPSGPLRLAPLLIGCGMALVVHALPWFEGGDGAVALGFAAACALLLAALGMLTTAQLGLSPRILTAGAVLIASFWWLRPPPALLPGFSALDERAWSVAAAADGTPLQAASRGAIWRVVEVTDLDGTLMERLARGRNLLTPELETPGPWARELDFALSIRPGARRMLFVGAPHPASLRAAARGGIESAVFAGDEAAVRLLRQHAPGGYGLSLSRAASIIRAPGSYDLILLRSGALWDEDLSLLRASVAAQAARKLAPEGFCLLAIGPEQLAPGILPALIAAWREVFPRVTLYAVPDGLRSVRLLLAAASHLEGEWPQLLRSMQVSRQELDAIAAESSRSMLAPPLPRVHASLADTPFRLADGLGAVRRAAEVLRELTPAPQAGAEAPPPNLLRAYALHYAVQEYSVHDDYLTQVDDAIEVRPETLVELLRLARAHPDSAWMRAIWSDVAGTIAIKREVALAEEFLRPLRSELGWRDPGISLALARAAAEMLDEEEARALLAEILRQEPAHAEAQALLRALDAGTGLAPDAHAGHGHD